LQGRIAAVEGDRIELDVESKPEPQRIAVAFDNIEKARLVPDWAALGFAPEKPGKKPGNKAAKKPGAGPSGKRSAKH
jgi:ribosome maturation factor RimP